MAELTSDVPPAPLLEDADTAHTALTPSATSVAPASPLVDEEGNTATIDDLFSQCDQGMTVLHALHGSSGASEASPTSVLFILTSVLPVALFASSYNKWYKAAITTLASFVSTLKANLADTYKAIGQITKKHGTSCRKAIQEATTAFFGEYGSSMHDAFTIGIFIFIWGTYDGGSALVLTIIERYLSTPDGDVDSLFDQCISGMLEYVPLQLNFDVRRSPGYRRLDFKSNPRGFTSAWRALWRMCSEVLCLSRPDQTDEVQSALTALDITQTSSL